MSAVKETFKAIDNAFSANGALKAKLKGGLHGRKRMPQKTVFPYATYHLVGMDNRDTLTEHYPELFVQFNIFSQNEYTDEACECFDALDAVFNDGTLTVTGYTHKYTRPDGLDMLVPNPDRSIQQYSVRYAILLKKN